MTTFHQMVSKYARITRKKKLKTPILDRCPQKRAHIERVLTKAPKKPHSARRSVAYVYVTSMKRRTYACVPGIGHSLRKFGKVLIRGGRRRDVPNLKCQIIRGGRMDGGIVVGRMKARSKYGLIKIRAPQVA